MEARRARAPEATPIAIRQYRRLATGAVFAHATRLVSPEIASSLLIVGLSVLLTGCGKKAADPMERAEPPKPKAAATMLDQAFSTASTEVKAYATTAAQALQTADYEGAVQSLQMIKQRGSLTVDQGLAVHNSMISLEARLIAAMSEGDENAKRAYEQLKKARRN